MDRLERLAYIVGTLLIGFSTYVVVTRRRAARERPPVTKLAHDLQEAWSVLPQPLRQASRPPEKVAVPYPKGTNA